MKYKPWITLTIAHAFFDFKKAGVNVVLTPETRLLMKAAGVVLRKMNDTTWVVLKPEFAEDESGKELVNKLIGEDLLFNLQPEADDFFHYTEWKKRRKPDDDWELCDQENACRGNKCIRIRVTESLLQRKKKITQKIHSRKVLWEFILIPKYSTGKYPVELDEKAQLLHFLPAKEIVFPGVEKAYRCVTDSVVPMRKNYMYQIRLWEENKNGKVLIAENIRHPTPHSASILKAKNVITSYFYF